MDFALAVSDRANSRDPTGTTSLRAKLRRASHRQIDQVRAQLRTAIVNHDLLGLGGPGSSMAYLPVTSRLAALHDWLSGSLQPFVRGDWVFLFLNQAWHSGEKAAAGETPAAERQESLHHILTNAKREIVGIAAALHQQVTRTADQVIMRKLSRATAWRLIHAVFNKVAVNRTNTLANTLVVTAHNRAKLSVYVSQGVERFGLIPEYVDSTSVEDAWNPFPAIAKAVGKLVKRWRRPKPEPPRLFSVKTAGDLKVCANCNDVADLGPYTAEEMLGLLPLHANCRCTPVPWEGPYQDTRDAGAFDPQKHPHRGKGFAGGQHW